MLAVNCLRKSNRSKLTLCLAGSLFFWHLSPALAATTPPSTVNIPNIADPARISQQLTTTEPVTKKVSPIVKLPYNKNQIAAEQAAQYKFKLTEVVISGATVLPAGQLIENFKPYFNKEISLATLQELSNKITNQYRNAGYILSKAMLPPQVIDKGVVRIQIIEGFVSNVIIEGQPKGAKTLLAKYGQQIVRSHPLRMQVLERYLLLANDIPGTRVHGILRASKTIPGSADLILVAKQQRIKGGIAYDNYGTRYLGPQETRLYTDINSLIQSGDKTSVNILTTGKNRELNYLQLDHSTPLGSRGTELHLGASYTETKPGSVLQPLEIEGKSTSAFGDISYPIIRSRASNLTAHGGFKYLNSETTLLSEPYYSDRIRALIGGGNYQFADALRGSNIINLEGEQGFNILGANNNGDHSRPDGHSNFTKFTTQLTRLQVLNNRFSILVNAQGQYAFVPLLAAEQFGFGGPALGRGYDPSEITGDRGIAGSAEFITNTEPGYRMLRRVQYYAFYDVGEIWNIDNVSQAAKASATSTGIGTRLYFTPTLTGNLFIAKPLTRKVASAVAVGENSRKPRVFFQLAFNI